MTKLKKIYILIFVLFLPHILFSQDVQDRYVEILKLQGQEKHDLAIEEYKALISDHPNFGKAYKSLAELYIDLKKIEKGETYFTQIISADSLNAYAFYCLARFEFAMNNYKKSLVYFKESISRNPQFVDAFSPNGGIIEVHQANGTLDDAFQYLDSLIAIYPQNPNVTYAFARAYQKKYDWQKCYEMLNQTKEIDPNYAYTYHALSTYFQFQGKYQKMSESAQKLFKFSNQQSDLQMAAYALSMIGVSHFYFGDYWKALQFNHKGLGIAKEIGDKSREGRILNNIAAFYATLGLRRKALQYFNSSLELARESNSSFGEMRALLNIGIVLKELGDFAKSEEYYQNAENLAHKLGYKFEECLIVTSLAEVFQKLKNYKDASKNFQRALKIAREIQDKTQEGYILRALGSLHLESGEYEDAIKFHKLALKIGKESNDLQIIWEALAGLGSDYRKCGKIPEAISHYSQAITLYDSVRSNLDIGSLTNNFLEDKYEAYPSVIQLFASQKQLDKAFLFAEKYKSKLSLDILAEGQIYIKNLLPDSLQSQLKNIRQQIETMHKNLSKEYDKSQPDQSQIIEFDQKITELELKKSDLISQVENDYSNYFQLTSSKSIKLEQLQTKVLEENQALLEYIFGPEKVSVFIIKQDSIHYIELELYRKELQKLLKNVSPIFSRFEHDSTKNLQIFHADLVDFSIAPIYELYLNIFQPVEHLIPDNSQLIIVPDDLLFYVPFEMLITDTTECNSKYDFKNAKFLLEKFAISYSSSASLLDPKLKTKRNPGKGFFAIGNPDFETLLSQDKSIREFRSIPQLPNSEIEVKKVSQLLAGVKRKAYAGNKATEQRFKSEASDFRIIHLATHFFLNDRLPLYSKLALTKTNQDEEDGFLNTYEIFNMNLNADFVVLSACNSALGRLSRGEGLLGISRSFLYAGVPSLLLSLWSVNDEATSDIMVGFYEYLKQGISKNKALQLAKLDFIKSGQDRYSDPFYWAPFVLIGDQGPIEFVEKESQFYKFTIWGIVLVLAVIVGILLRIRKRKLL